MKAWKTQDVKDDGFEAVAVSEGLDVLVSLPKPSPARR
jgi:hypothetical protein